MKKEPLPAEVVKALLEEDRQRFQAGDKAALLSAIRLCFNEYLVAPEWVIDAFFKATNKWYSMQAKTLDEAFDVRWPKGKSLAAAKKRRRLKFAVWIAVREAQTAGRAVDDELFEEIGSRFGIGKTLVKDYYRNAMTLLAQPSAADMLLEPFIIGRQGRKK